MNESQLTISPSLSISLNEVQLSAIRAQGAGGQNVNKVSSAIHLRFDINASSLPDWLKEALLNLNDKRITQDGCLVLKAQQYRTQEQNREDALNRLVEIILKASQRPTTRIATRPSLSAKRKRTDSKTRRGEVKQLRGKISVAKLDK